MPFHNCKHTLISAFLSFSTSPSGSLTPPTLLYLSALLGIKMVSFLSIQYLPTLTTIYRACCLPTAPPSPPPPSLVNFPSNTLILLKNKKRCGEMKEGERDGTRIWEDGGGRGEKREDKCETKTLTWTESSKRKGYERRRKALTEFEG